MQHQQQQHCLLAAAAPRKKKEASSPWWDFFSHCKEAADSDSEDGKKDDMSYVDYDNRGCATISAGNDALLIKPVPLSPAYIVRTPPLKLISSTQSNDAADGESDSRPETPGTQNSSFETSSSSSLLPEDCDDDVSTASSSQSIEVDEEEDVEDEECHFIGEITPGSLVFSPQAQAPPSLKLITTSVVVMPPPPQEDATQYNINKQLHLLQSISEEEQQWNNVEDEDDTTTTSNDDTYNTYNNFIGEIEIMPISPLLSTHQRNIRKNAYNLLKRLGEEESLFDVNSVEEIEVVGGDEQEEEETGQRQMELQEEVDELKRQLGECTHIVVQLQDNLRSCSNDATNDHVISKGINQADGNNKDDGKADELHARIAKLSSQLQSTTLQTAQDNSKIQSLESQLQHALQESSHHLDRIQEYEETIDSLNEAVVRSHLYNEEIVKELMILRKENDDLKIRLVGALADDKKREEEKEEADEKELPLLEGEGNASTSIATANGATDGASEASFEDDVIERDDDVVTAMPDVTAVTTTMTWSSLPSVFHRQQQPLPLQAHLLSCIKLPLRVVSILFSVWLTIILLRIILIFFFMVADNNLRIITVEDDGFNSPGIY